MPISPVTKACLVRKGEEREKRDFIREGEGHETEEEEERKSK